MAVRGLLKCPPEHRFLLSYMIDSGIRIEMEKELYYSKLNHLAMNKQTEDYEKIMSTLMKLLFPDMKDDKESFMEKAKKTLVGGSSIMRIQADTKTAIKSENPLERFKNA